MMPGHLARSDAPTMATERALRMVLMGLNKSLLAFGAADRSRAPPGRAAPSHPGFGCRYSQATDLAVAAGTAARTAAPMAPKRPTYFIVLALPVVSAVMTFRRYRSFQERTAPLWQINARLTMAGGEAATKFRGVGAGSAGVEGAGGNRGVGRGDMRVWPCRGRRRSSRRPYGKEGFRVQPDEGRAHRAGPPAMVGVFLS